MTKAFFFLLTCSLFFLACISPNQRQVQATTQVQESDPIPMVMNHEPYVVTDSANMLTLSGGVQLYFVKKGQGAQAKADDIVRVHYEGSLTDGKVFDSSYDRAQPVDLNMATLIHGLKIALAEVPVGSKVKVWVPADMAYGDSIPMESIIPPNADLSFDVEVLEVK